MFNQKYHQFDNFYNHKFGFHILGGNQGFGAALDLKAKVVKTMDFSVEPLRQLREKTPDVFLIGRLYVQPQDFGQLAGGFNPALARQRAVEMADKILALEINQDQHHVNGQPILHAWESLNEVLPESAPADLHKLYDEYQVAFVEKMRTAGFEAIAQNFGTGNGTGEQWLSLYPGTLASYKFLGFHEYDWPTLDRLHRQGLAENNGGMWLALRYRRIMEGGIRQQYGDQHVCIITECGMTQGVQGGQDIGHRATENTVPGNDLPMPIPEADYWQTLQWYNSELMKDEYLMGACLFVTGATGQWTTFEHLGSIMARLADYQQIVPISPPARTYAVAYVGHNAPATMVISGYSSLSLTIRNTGNWSWPATGLNPVRVSYRWLTTDGRLVPETLWETVQTALPFSVAPNEAVTLQMTVAAPRAVGPLILQIDLVEELVTWFSQQNGATLRLPVQISSTAPATDRSAKWRVRASHNNTETGPDNLLQAIDEISSTRWSSQTPQEPGMWFEVDLGEVATVHQIRLDNADSPNDYPRGYRLQVSTEAQNWRVLAALANNTQPLNLTVTPTPARYIRIEQTGSSDRWWWSIHEIDITTDSRPTLRASHNNSNLGRDGLRYALDGNPYTRWSSRAVQQPGMWLEIDLQEVKQVRGLALDNRLSPYEYPRGYVIRVSRDGEEWAEVANQPANKEPVEVSFSPQLVRYIRIDQTGRSSRWWWAVHDITLQAETISLSAMASHHNVTTGPGNLLQALNGQSGSGWRSYAPQQPGMWFELDLNRVRWVRGLQLDSTGSPHNYPRGYRVELSADRQQWAEVAHQAANDRPLVDIEFLPRPARYIRVTLTASAESWWSINELNVKYGGGELSGRASHNNGLWGRYNVSLAFDGQPATRWASLRPQQPGMWFEIDLGETCSVKGLALQNEPASRDYPRGYSLFVSTDGEDWLEVARQPYNHQPLEVAFAPHMTRYLRLVLTAPARNWWSISAVTVVRS